MNNKDKQNQLRSIVMEIHAGKNPRDVKKKFDRLIRNVSPEEIAEMEQGLIQEGVPVEQVQSLCDIHVSVFKSAIEEAPKGKVLPGHPVHSYKEENRIARKHLRKLLRESRQIKRSSSRFMEVLEEMEALEIHFQRKENQLFPYLETVNFTGPSKVMWGKHDEIREAFKEVRTAYNKGDKPRTRRKVKALAGAVRRMIFMEERILFPAALRKLPEKAWVEIREGEAQIGYAWITPGNLWDANVARMEISGENTSAGSAGQELNTASPAPAVKSSPLSESSPDSRIPLETGELLPSQINMMLKALPFDLTFVDSDDKVRYYSQGKERLFPRSPGIIGRDVANCHPPKSVHIVEKIVQSFRNREKDVAEFWFTVNERFIHIRYFPVYSELGLYKGTIEVSQDVTDIRNLEGVQKLLDRD